MTTLHPELVAQLRANTSSPLFAAAASALEGMSKTAAEHSALLDHAASLLTEALHSEDGVDSVQAEACIERIRGAFIALGKTTAEEYVDRLYTRIGMAAGLPAGSEFDPIHVLNQMQTVISVQGRNGQYLEWALKQLWDPERRALIVSPPNDNWGTFKTFPEGTDWTQALDQVLAEQAAAAPNPAMETA